MRISAKLTRTLRRLGKSIFAGAVASALVCAQQAVTTGQMADPHTLATAAYTGGATAALLALEKWMQPEGQ